jgi:hypothetical protein
VPLLAYGAIDDELEIMYGHMATKTMDLLALFYHLWNPLQLHVLIICMALMFDRGSKG